MNTDLSAFSVSTAGECSAAHIDLVGGSQTSAKRYNPGRQIERWQSQLVATRLLHDWSAHSPYDLERQLARQKKGVAFPADRPRLFHRLLKDGEPAIARALLKRSSASTQWIQDALSRSPSAVASLDAPAWRLLDPASMNSVQWHDIAKRFGTESMAMLERGARHESWRVQLSVDPDGGESVEYFVPCTSPGSLFGLELTLLQLRRWESVGRLVGYYLQLLELMERCTVTSPDPDLGVLLPGLRQHLIECFSRVCIAPSNPENLEYQLSRLCDARKAFESVRGTLGASALPQLI
jgi:hypothetical protein